MPSENELLSQGQLIEKDKREHLTAAEKLIAFGDPGPPRTVMYRRGSPATPGGADTLISRVFNEHEKIDPKDGWVDSPAVLGFETQPARSAPGTNPEEVVGTLPPVPDPKPAPKGKG